MTKPAPPSWATRYAGPPGTLLEALLGENTGPGSDGDGCNGCARCTPADRPRIAANVGDPDPRSWPLPGDWPYRLIQYIEACHVWLSSAAWSITRDAPQHGDPYRCLFPSHRPTANAVDSLLREWVAGGFVRVEGGLPAPGEPYDDRRLRLTHLGYELLAELRARYR
jgi:hypothetical protein